MFCVWRLEGHTEIFSEARVSCSFRAPAGDPREHRQAPEAGSDSLPLAEGQLLAPPLLSPPGPVTASPVLHVPSASRCQEVYLLVCWANSSTAPPAPGQDNPCRCCSRGIREPLLSPRTVSLEGTHPSSLHARIRALPAGPGLHLSCLRPSLHVLLGSHRPGHLQGTQESAEAWPPYGTPDMAAPRERECRLPTR